MKSIYLLLFIFILTVVIKPTPVQGQDMELLSGYVLCEAGGQLTWFLGFSGVSDLFNSDYSANKYDPDDQIPISAKNKKARKALNNGWCMSTENMSNFSVNVLENCTEGFSGMPLPNGGCRKIQIKPVTPQDEDPNWTTWYTFGDTIVEKDKN